MAPIKSNKPAKTAKKRARQAQNAAAATDATHVTCECGSRIRNNRHSIASHRSKKHKADGAYARHQQSGPVLCRLCGDVRLANDHSLVRHWRSVHGHTGKSTMVPSMRKPSQQPKKKQPARKGKAKKDDDDDSDSLFVNDNDHDEDDDDEDSLFGDYEEDDGNNNVPGPSYRWDDKDDDGAGGSGGGGNVGAAVDASAELAPGMAISAC